MRLILGSRALARLAAAASVVPVLVSAATCFAVGSLAGCGDGASEPPHSPAVEQRNAVPHSTHGPDAVPKRPSNADVRAELEAAQRKNGAAKDPHEGAAGAMGTAADGGAPATGAADATASAADGGAGSNAPDPNAAGSDTDADRRDFDTKARARLAQIDARAKELKQQGAKLASTKKTSFDSSWNRFAADRTDAEAKLGALGRSGAGWRAAKSGMERTLDALEAALAKMDDQI